MQTSRPPAASYFMMDVQWDEYELALRARDGDGEALAELVERTRLRLFALAYRELSHYEDAQDALASAVLKICQHIGELREPGSVRAWMLMIVRNEAHALRRGRGAPPASLEEAESWTEETEASLLRLEIEYAHRSLPRHRELPTLAEKHHAIGEAAGRLREAKEAFYAYLAGV